MAIPTPVRAPTTQSAPVKVGAPPKMPSWYVPGVHTLAHAQTGPGLWRYYF